MYQAKRDHFLLGPRRHPPGNGPRPPAASSRSSTPATSSTATTAIGPGSGPAPIAWLTIPMSAFFARRPPPSSASAFAAEDATLDAAVGRLRRHIAADHAPLNSASSAFGPTSTGATPTPTPPTSTPCWPAIPAGSCERPWSCRRCSPPASAWPPPTSPMDRAATRSGWQSWADRLGAAIAGSIAWLRCEGTSPATASGSSAAERRRDPRSSTTSGTCSPSPASATTSQAGDDRVELAFRGFRILLQVCYDLRFPVFVRNDRHTPYDLSLYVAVAETRSAAWRTLLRAAIENQCFVVGINRSGTDGNGHRYAGDSLIADFRQEHLLADAGNNGQPATIKATLNRDKMMAFRRKLPFLEDADARQRADQPAERRECGPSPGLWRARRPACRAPHLTQGQFVVQLTDAVTANDPLDSRGRKFTGTSANSANVEPRFTWACTSTSE